MRFRSNLVLRLDSTVVSWRSLEGHGEGTSGPTFPLSAGPWSENPEFKSPTNCEALSKFFNFPAPWFLHPSNGYTTSWGWGRLWGRKREGRVTMPG